MTKAGIMKTVSLKGKEKFLRLGVERYTALFDIAKKNDRDMTKQLDFFMDKFYPNVTGENRHLRLKNIAVRILQKNSLLANRPRMCFKTAIFKNRISKRGCG